MTVYLNIGTNVGNREQNLRDAMAMLRNNPGFRSSAIVESEPWGYESPNKFLNVGVAFEENALKPEQILSLLHQIEQKTSMASHRTQDGNYADRIVDVDIVAIDDLVMDTPRLTLPHPHLAKREFFLVPMKELAPDWRHPATGKTPAEMLSSLQA